MKNNTLFIMAISALVSATSCRENTENSKQDTNTAEVVRIDSMENVSTCNIELPGIHFTRSLNGADSLVNIEEDKLEMQVGAKKDYFNDPDGKLSNNTAPILLTKVDNTKPFTLVSKVTPTFTQDDKYNAGVLYIFVNNNLYQKHCFEQDERGNHRVVTVRTNKTSDDSNHDIVTQPYVYMKISSDTKTVASYYSLDNKTWHMVRLYKNEYPAEIWLGVSAQCPQGEGSVSTFEGTALTENSVSDFRLGV